MGRLRAAILADACKRATEAAPTVTASREQNGTVQRAAANDSAVIQVATTAAPLQPMGTPGMGVIVVG